MRSGVGCRYLNRRSVFIGGSTSRSVHSHRHPKDQILATPLSYKSHESAPPIEASCERCASSRRKMRRRITSFHIDSP